MPGQGIRSAFLVAALATVVAACGDAAEPPATTQPPPATTAAVTSSAPTSTTTASTTVAATATTTTTTATTRVTTTTAPPDDGVTRVAVTVAGGAVAGGLEVVPVPLGGEVLLTVTADVADEVHVHGYNLFAAVGPGAPAAIEFTADIPGIFEVELEGARLPVVELEVS